ncbi:thioredoxin family protein [Sphingobacteriales bacterium UPWRP_1]|nr:hypothetical protein B6N25_14330 [Sphingobacteriales bacterium TSM_CSS]PSJ78887.1 thioredoxin family protein [Sphingobacteriales bacterium UPWRP_1]
MKRLILLISLCLLTTNFLQLSAQPVGINFCHDSWENLLQKARNEGKYVFVELYGNTCIHCRNMDTFVFTHPNVYILYNQHFVSTKINYSEDSQDFSYYELAHSYSVDLSGEVLPVLLYFDYEGNLIRKETGGKSITDMIYIGNKVITNPYENGIIAGMNEPPAASNGGSMYDGKQPSDRPTTPLTEREVQVKNTQNYVQAGGFQSTSDPAPEFFNTQSPPPLVIKTPEQPSTRQPQDKPRFNDRPDVRAGSSVVVVSSQMEADYKRLNELRQYFRYSDTTTNQNTIIEYAYLLKKLHQAFNQVVNYYLELEKANLYKEQNKNFIYDFAINLENKAIDYLVADIQYYKTRKGGEAVNSQVKNAINYTVLTAIREKDRKLFTKAEQVIYRSHLPNYETFLFEMRSLFYQGIEDWSAYSKMVSRYMEENTISDPVVLNDIALKFQRNVNDKKMLKKAIGWVQESIRIENEFYNNYTYALLLVRTNEPQKAYSAAQNAIYVAQMRRDGTDISAALQLVDRLSSEFGDYHDD